MATNRVVVVNKAFDFGGRRFHVGDTFADTEYVYTIFPSNFDLQPAYVYGSAGTVLTGGTLGTIISGKLPVTDASGTVLGYVALYNTITGT